MKKVLITLLITGLVFSAQVNAQQGKGSDKPPTPPKPHPVKVKTPPQPQALKVQKPPVPKTVNVEAPKPVKPLKPGEVPAKPQNLQGKDNAQKEVKEKENQGKGHAYGKNKEGLEGKEFGQHRAAEAKSKHEAVTNSQQAIDNTAKTNSDTQAKIKEAKDKLEKNKKEKKISDADYNKKKKELDDLEKQVKELEKKNSDVKNKLDKESSAKDKK
ncbi:MAG TPA: hypothetical protein PKL96_10120 [Bacteroidales bacterium]|nr:hypothetical protein [Bacteroidales bacterium]HPS28004.1 hypothetical protein [Bacteroidales bacterium]